MISRTCVSVRISLENHFAGVVALERTPTSLSSARHPAPRCLFLPSGARLRTESSGLTDHTLCPCAAESRPLCRTLLPLTRRSSRRRVPGEGTWMLVLAEIIWRYEVWQGYLSLVVDDSSARRARAQHSGGGRQDGRGNRPRRPRGVRRRGLIDCGAGRLEILLAHVIG
jgi:hypothetical protein